MVLTHSHGTASAAASKATSDAPASTTASSLFAATDHTTKDPTLAEFMHMMNARFDAQEAQFGLLKTAFGQLRTDLTSHLKQLNANSTESGGTPTPKVFIHEQKGGSSTLSASSATDVQSEEEELDANANTNATGTIGEAMQTKNDEDEGSLADDEEDELSDEEAARKLQEMKNATMVNQDIIPFHKGFELCCFKCNCANCTESSGDPLKLMEVLPSFGELKQKQQNCQKWYVRLHRPCCTTIKKISGEYALTSYEQSVMQPQMPKKRRIDTIKISRSDLSKAKIRADSLKTTVMNDYSCKDPVHQMQTDPRYNDICNVFHNVKKEALLKEANILSVFSGIGSGILVLKRLKIAINHCVVVEHDPLAEAVCSSNHKKDVGSYHHISTFDMLEESIDDIMEKFGPFHVIEGGPPCVEYSGANANRGGVQSKKGQYMPRFAKLIHRIKNHDHQKGEYLFFVCENVPTNWDDQKHIEPLFGISPIAINALAMSPAKRNRAYYTNIPVNELPPPDSKEALSSVKLPGGWMTLAQMHCHLNNEPEPYSKAMTFMASEGKIDNGGMMKVRLDTSKEGGQFEVGYYSVADRESLLGYSAGYVEKPVTLLFDKLNVLFHSENWLDDLFMNKWDYDEIIEFSGRNYKFGCNNCNDPSVSVKIGTAEKNGKGNTLYFLDRDGYCKRLLGNGYSIPVVEHLMRPLKDLFSEKEYSDADYRFTWQSDSDHSHDDIDYSTVAEL